MKNLSKKALIAAVLLVSIVSCTPETILGDDYNDEVDKDKIERPGSQGSDETGN